MDYFSDVDSCNSKDFVILISWSHWTAFFYSYLSLFLIATTHWTTAGSAY